MNFKAASEDRKTAEIAAESSVPNIPSTRRKSRGEQINFSLKGASLTTAEPQKRKKNWRSPSNPIDFMNCIRRVRDEQESDAEKVVSPCSSSTLKPQLNFDYSSKSTASQKKSLLQDFEDFSADEDEDKIPKTVTMTKSSRTERTECVPLLPYESLLFRKPQSRLFVMLAELSISPIVSTGSSDYSSTRRHVFAFESAYSHADADSTSFDSTSLAHGHIDPNRSDDLFAALNRPDPNTRRRNVSFSRCSLLQVILRNPEDNSVAGIFVVKLDLSDMPGDSRTILRQKAYKSKCLEDCASGESADYLAKFIEIPLKRTYDNEANRQKITLAGPIRVAFSFNRSNLRFTTPRRSDASAVEPVQKTSTILQFPSIHQKYFPIHPQTTTQVQISETAAATATTVQDRQRSNSLNSENIHRSFQHGSICL